MNNLNFSESNQNQQVSTGINRLDAIPVAIAVPIPVALVCLRFLTEGDFEEQEESFLSMNVQVLQEADDEVIIPEADVEFIIPEAAQQRYFRNLNLSVMNRTRTFNNTLCVISPSFNQSRT